MKSALEYSYAITPSLFLSDMLNTFHSSSNADFISSDLHIRYCEYEGSLTSLGRW